jgi:hypothetical protein
MKWGIAKLAARLARKIFKETPLSDLALEIAPLEKASPSFFNLSVTFRLCFH